jgi:hypothetical protein
MATSSHRPSPHLRVSGLLASAIIATVLSACVGGPPNGSPSPAGSPLGSPTPDGTSSPSPTGPAGDISHPTGATDVILRMEHGGGFVPMGWLVTQAPYFTLYGDGTFIIQPLEDPDLAGGWESGQPRFLKGHLDEESVQSLLEHALTTGRLAVARDHYPFDNIADASTTIFNINAGGFEKEVSVYALGEAFEGVPDPVDRAGFNQLAELLRSFEDRARSGALGEVVLYEATHYRVTLMEAFGQPVGQPVPWPWEHIVPTDFEPVGEFGLPQAVVSAADVAQLIDVPTGGHQGIAVTYEGADWLLGIRPLLPDETQ